MARGRNWAALASSTAVHLSLVLWLVLRPPVASPEAPLERQPGTDRQELALAPPAKAVPTPRPQPAMEAPPPSPESSPRPEPPREATPLGPDSRRPDAPVPQEAGPEKPKVDPDQMDMSKTEEPAKPAPPPAEPEATPSDAPRTIRRIATAGDMARNRPPLGVARNDYGSARDILDIGEREATGTALAMGSMGRVGPSSPDNRDWRPSFPEAAGRCVEIPDLGTNPDGTPVLASVIGRVLTDDRSSPLPGAHLQIVGTPFATFSNGNGEYRLEFDPRLLERCRVQYVRVVREGFSGQLLTLAIGQRITSDDVVLHRR